MTGVKCFEDLKVWQKARLFSTMVYEVTRTTAFSRDFRLTDQLRGAAISVMSNIAEGFERDGNSEFRQSCFIAKGETGEARSQLYIALDAGYLSETQFQTMYKCITEISAMLVGLTQYLHRTEMRGKKY